MNTGKTVLLLGLLSGLMLFWASRNGLYVGLIIVAHKLRRVLRRDILIGSVAATIATALYVPVPHIILFRRTA